MRNLCTRFLRLIRRKKTHFLVAFKIRMTFSHSECHVRIARFFRRNAVVNFASNPFARMYFHFGTSPISLQTHMLRKTTLLTCIKKGSAMKIRYLTSNFHGELKKSYLAASYRVR